MVGDVGKPCTTIFSREIQSSHVTLAMLGVVLLKHLSRFSIDCFQLCRGNPYDSAGMAYELIASKVCLLESSLFRITFNRLKFSFLSADLVVLLVVRLSPKPKYLYCWFNSSHFSSSPLSSWMFSI